MLSNFKYLIAGVCGGIIVLGTTVYALPTTRYEQNIFPFVTDTYDLGSTTPTNRWLHLFTKYASTSALSITGITGSTQCLQVDATGLVSGVGASCGSGGGGTVGTSSPVNIGDLAMWTTSGATPELLGSVATTSITCTGDISCTGFIALGSNSTISFTGSYVPTTRTLTVAGTANQISSSAGAQDLSANRTWTLSLPNHVIFPSSFQATSATTTNATSTNHDITGLLTFNGVTGDEWTDFCSTITGSAGLCDGNDASGGDGGSNWTVGSGSLHNSTTTDFIGIGTSTPYSKLSIWSNVGIPSTDVTILEVVDQASTTVFRVDQSNGGAGVSEGLIYAQAWYATNDPQNDTFLYFGTGDDSWEWKSAGSSVFYVDVPNEEISFNNDQTLSDFIYQSSVSDSLTHAFHIEGSNGNVGIGTSSPYARLSVAGETVSSYFTATTTATSTFGGAITVTETNATSTFAGGIDLSDGCFAIDGVCLTSATIDGSGAANRAAFWTDANTLASDDSFVWDNTNKRLGIGTTSPISPLSLVGALTISNNTANDYLTVSHSGGGDVLFEKQNICSTCGYSFEAGGVQQFFISDRGKAGILANFGPLSSFDIYASTTSKVSNDPSDETLYNLLLSHSDDNAGAIEHNPSIGFLADAGTEVTAAIWSATTSTNGKGRLDFYTKQNTTNNGDPTFVMTLSDAGFVGIGTTTPWAKFSISNATISDYSLPIFAVATSSSPMGRLLEIFSTQTILQPLGSDGDSGVRVVVGNSTSGHYDLENQYLDQFEINGRLNTMEWTHYYCGGISAPVTLTADQAGACGPWAFQEDTAATWSAGNDVAGVPNGNLNIVFGNPNDGAGLFLGGVQGVLNLQTVTPVIEAIGRIRSAQATTTTYVLGFTNLTPGGTTFETAPTAGCYIIASSTQINWQAVCGTSAANSTIVDTGFASTTVSTGDGNFYRFRIEADSDNARFFMGSSTASLQLVADINTNYPAATDLNAGMYFGRTSATESGVSSGWGVVSLRAWLRDNVIPQ